LGQAGLFEEEAKKASLATSAALNKGQGEPKKIWSKKYSPRKICSFKKIGIPISGEKISLNKSSR